MGKQEREAAGRAWEQLDPAVRQEVRRLAREGRAHPDPEVAAVALDWARSEQQPPAARQYAILGAVLVAAALVFPLVTSLPGRSPQDMDGVDVILLLIPFVVLAAAFDWRRRASAKRVEQANAAAAETHPDT